MKQAQAVKEAERSELATHSNWEKWSKNEFEKKKTVMLRGKLWQARRYGKREPETTFTMVLNSLSNQASEFTEADLPRHLSAEAGVVSIHYFQQPCPELSLHMTPTGVIK